MLGMRGVRLGIAMPEIYDMQARAIFEATVEASRLGDPVVPEIMIPLVSARREVELVKSRIDAVAAEVRNAKRAEFTYRLGVMVETPRAALRAGEIAQHAAFLSFGTNDLTQMTYGLSRDDAGRFMGAYVQQGVFPEDPFHVLDTEGVGELLQHRRRAWPRGATRRDPVDLRRARRQPRIHRLLPRRRIRLCVVLALPGSGRPAGGGATGVERPSFQNGNN